MTVEEIFLGAVELAPADRPAFLDRACAGDHGRRAQVEDLLRSHEEAGSLLDRPLFDGGPTADYPTGGPIGRVVGPYKLLQKLGEGGMGEVWMAEQTSPVQRRVAVKIIRPGMDSAQVVARFEAERQALALMDHPNIARVLDAGETPDGRPFFVMELVKGTPITRYCDEYRLDPRQRLELFLSVCHAVQHAHQKGIIHRDIKPSNVLVAPYDGRPVVKVIDFGVAKAAGPKLTDRTLFTAFGTVVGTLEYMSPEQAELNNQDVDTRSDIYSLGVLLYELLTGTTPLDRKRLREAAFAEVLRVIREEEPQKPSTRLSTTEELPSVAAQRQTDPAKLTRLVRGELDWIAMRALEKDRTRRYETATGLAQDLQRYLADEPVLACPPSASYRLRKFTRRNRRGLVTAVILVVALLVAIGGIGWAVRDRAARDEQVARDRVGRREKLEAEVGRALDDVRDWTRKDNPTEARSALKRADGLLATGEVGDDLRDLAARWRAELDALRQIDEARLRAFDQESRQARAEAADADLRRAFAGLGIDIDALPPEEAAARIRGRLAPARLAEALDYWGWVRQELTYLKLRPQEARQRVHRVARLADPHPLRDRARLAAERWDAAEAARVAADPGVLELPAATLRVLAMVLYRGRPDQRATAMRLLTDAQARRPGDFWLNQTLGSYYWQMTPPRWAEVNRYFAIALALRPDSASLHWTLGQAFQGQGKYAEAETLLRRAIELDPGYAPAPIHADLGAALVEQGKLDEAVAEYRRAIEIDPKYTAAHNNLGTS